MSDSDEQYRRVVELSPDGIFITRDCPNRVREPGRGPHLRRLVGRRGAGPIAIRLLSHRSARPPSRSRLETARRRHRAGERRARGGTQWHGHRSRSRLHPVRGFARPRDRVGDARHHRAQTDRGRPARERGAAVTRLRRRPGRRVGLEPRDRARRVLGALEADARLRAITRSSRTSAPWSGCCTPTTRSARASSMPPSRAASARIKPSSACATKTDTTWTCSRAASRSAANPADRSCASSAPISI